MKGYKAYLSYKVITSYLLATQNHGLFNFEFDSAVPLRRKVITSVLHSEGMLTWMGSAIKKIAHRSAICTYRLSVPVVYGKYGSSTNQVDFII
jgi:hypothetical protein